MIRKSRVTTWGIVLGVAMATLVYGQHCTNKALVPATCTTPARTTQGNRNQACCTPPPCSSPPVPQRQFPPTPEAQTPPAAPAGVYVAPPQSGVVRGPQRGYESGTISVTLPELTLSLPRLRFHGASHFLRNGHMEIDAANAPFVPHPFAQQTAMQPNAPAPSSSPQPENAPDETPEPDRAPNPSKTPSQCAEKASDQGSSCNADLQRRLDNLERHMAKQCDALEQCLNQIKQQQRMNPPHPECIETPPSRLPPPREKSPMNSYRPRLETPPQGRPTMQVLPPTEGEVNQAAYLRPITTDSHAKPSIRRLPPLEDVLER